MPQHQTENQLFTRLAPLIFIVIWSCGYIVAKYVVPYAPPMTFLSYRYIGIVLMLGLLALWAKATFPSGKLFWHTVVVGVLMQAGYLTGCWMGIAQGMPAGVMALIVNLQPVLTAILTVLFLNVHGNGNGIGNTENTVSRRQWLGLVMGLAGVALVLSTKLGAISYASFGWLAVVLGFGALVAMTVGTLYQKQFCQGVDPRSGQAVQSAASLIVTAPFAWALEAQPVLWTAPFWGALVFSVVVLSGMGTGLLLWLINRGSATKVTALMYWVPPVSSVMAWTMFDERIAPAAWPGFILVALGVYWVVGSANKPTAEAHAKKQPSLK